MGKLSSAYRLQGFADHFRNPLGDILDSNGGERLGNEFLGEFATHAGNQEDRLVQFAPAIGIQTLFRLTNERFNHITGYPLKAGQLGVGQVR